MTDDLTGLFANPPPGPAQPMLYRTGTITAWDPNSLANTVLVGSSSLTDLPVLGVAEARSYAVGAEVAIVGVGNTLAIIGRFVTPGTADAENAISLLSNSTQANFVPDEESCTLALYGDLPSFGPQVTINVGPSGKVLIILSASIGMYTESIGGDGTSIAAMSIGISGATTEPAPGDGSYTSVGILVNDGIGSTDSTDPIHQMQAQFTYVGYHTVNPGINTFTAKYQGLAPVSGDPPQISDRALVIIAL